MVRCYQDHDSNLVLGIMQRTHTIEKGSPSSLEGFGLGMCGTGRYQRKLLTMDSMARAFIVNAVTFFTYEYSLNMLKNTHALQPSFTVG